MLAVAVSAAPLGDQDDRWHVPPLTGLQGPICYLLAVVPTSWLLDTRGLRLVCLLAAGGVFLGCALRCFRADNSTLCLVLAHVGQALNGLAGPVAMAAAPVLSATWWALWSAC